MQSVSYNFKTIPHIPDSSGLIDIILSKTQRKTPTVVHSGYKIQRIRKFYMRKIKFAYSCIEEKLDAIVSGFPKLEDIHPFYADLINILYDKDHFKMALGYINTAKNLCEKVSKDYIKLMKYADSLYRCKQLKVASLGRMATIMKKLNSSLKYLEEVRKHLGRLPTIDPFSRTLLLTGFPNVGKSSFMNLITNAESEVQPYPFTTQSLWAGHTEYKQLKWQVIDTPGILDRPLEDRNTIEMQAITALAHLESAILYFIDISESCGYSLSEQLSLFTSIKPLFKNKPLLIILNKIDLRPYSELGAEEKQIIENAAKENNTYLIQMSNQSHEGVMDVKTKACDFLLEYRLANSAKNLKPGVKEDTFANRVHIAQPVKRDNKLRKPFIPDSVLAQRSQETDELNQAKAANPQAHFLKSLKQGQDEGLERFIPREKIENLQFKDTEFILENPEWNDDIWPEFMDGKNIFDFIDKDIQQKVEKLEQEEEERMRGQMEENLDVDLEDSDLDEEMLDVHDDMMENVDKIKTMHKNVKKSQLPRKVRGLTFTEKFMTELRTDTQENTEKLQLLSLKKRQEEKEKTRKQLGKFARLRDEDIPSEDDELDMEIDGERRPRTEEKRKREAESKHKEKVIQRIKDKIQKKFNREGRVNEADRMIGTKLPRHLNTGKRGIGKTDRR